MLIASNRHTPSDLIQWAEMEQADWLNGERLSKSGRGEIAIEEMRRFASDGPCYVSVSWGKDSVVIAHLLAVSGLDLPLVNVAQHGPQYDRDCPKVRDAFLARFCCNYREIVVESDNSRQHDSQKSPGLMEGIKVANRMYGTARYVGGVRASESGVRKVGMRFRGLTCNTSCQPIGWWSDAEAFGWLAYHNLPVHPAYAMLGGGRYDRNRIRVSIIGGAKGRGGFRGPWEREYYGDVLNRMRRVRTA